MSETLETKLQLGRSALMVPRIALGCGNFGGVGSAPDFFGQGLSEDQAFELMDAAWEFGLTHFDTADAYGGGRSELAIGRWIASRGVRPQLTTRRCWRCARNGGSPIWRSARWPAGGSPASTAAASRSRPARG